MALNGPVDRYNILVKEHFTKKFTFTKQRSWSLPPPSDLWTGTEWIDERLTAMKDELNSAKSQLNDKERGPWRTHTQSTNPAGTIVSNLKRRFKPQLCTQAWAKFFEILANYEPLLLDLPSDIPLRTLHLCESPGAFVTAFNHFLTLNCPKRKKNWRWIGTTLNPYYEGNSQDCMIADDRFIMHTLDNWEFGRDNTGDVMSPTNLQQLEQRTKKFGIISLVTADGSIDCHTNPSEQESQVAKLHYCEVVTTLALLGNSSNFVIKMFTFFESSAIVLVYLLTCAFKTVHLFKPGTSKAGNSEVYVICLNYQQHLMKQYDSALRKVFDRPSNSRQMLLSREQIPDDFVQQIYECSSIFKDTQVSVINKNLQLYPKMAMDERQHYDELQSACLHFYISNFRVGRIKDMDLIVPRNKMKPVSKDLFPINTLDSFNDVRERLKMPRNEKLQLMEKQLRQLMPENWIPDELVAGELEYEALDSGRFLENFQLMRAEHVTLGKSIKSKQSSRFSYQYLLNLWNELVAELPACENNGNSLWEGLDLNALLMEHAPVPLTESNKIWVLDATNSSDANNVNGSASQFKRVNLLDHVKNFNLDSNNGSGDETKTFTGTTIDISLEKQLWAEALLFTLNNFCSNDCLILVTGNLITRFVVGCLHILTHWFKQIKLVRPQSVPSDDPMTFVICQSYHVQSTFNHLEFLKFVQSRLKTETDDESVLEIVPVSQLVSDENFFSWLYDFNKGKMGQQLYKLLKMHIR